MILLLSDRTRQLWSTSMGYQTLKLSKVLAILTFLELNASVCIIEWYLVAIIDLAKRSKTMKVLCYRLYRCPRRYWCFYKAKSHYVPRILEVLVSMETVDTGGDVVGCEGVVDANSWYSCWLKATTKRDNKLLFRQNSHTKVILFQYNDDCFTHYTCFVVIIPAFDIVGKLVLFSPSVGIWQLTILTDRVILKASARNFCDSLAEIVTVLPGDGGFCEYVVASNACLLIYLITTFSCKEFILYW